MTAPRLRAGHLRRHRPVAARRAIGGQVRLVIVADARERAAMIAATVTGLIACGLLAVGVAVIL